MNDMMSAVARPAIRSLVAACRAAIRAGAAECDLRMTDGSVHGFTLVDVLDDALLGSRNAAPQKACVVSLSAVAMIEFGS